MKRLAAWLMALLLAIAFASPALADNRIRNGSFEDVDVYHGMTLNDWTWLPWHNAPAACVRDEDVSSRGLLSMRLSKTTHVEPNIYGMLYQTVTGLKPGSMLYFSAMVKGKSVERCMIGDWNARLYTPNGDFDWTLLSGSYLLGDDETEFTMRICVEGQTEALWVDDVRVYLAGETVKDDDRLFTRHLQDPTKPTGFEIIPRNPASESLPFDLRWTLRDAFGAPVREDRSTVTLPARCQTRVFIPVPPEERVAALTASLKSDAGELLAGATDYVAIEPPTLAPVKGSKRFGFCGGEEGYVQGDLYRRLLDLYGASGCASQRGWEMDHSFDYDAKTLSRTAFAGQLADLRALGMDQLPILCYAPPWASTAPPDIPENMRRFYMPDIPTWNQLVRDFVTAYNFRMVELWNEPNGGGWNTFPKDRTYGKLLVETWKTVKAIDPSILVVACSGYDSPGWPESVLKAVGAKYMDGISFHPYRRTGPWPGAAAAEKSIGPYPSYPEIVSQMNEMTARYNDGKPIPLYATEMGANACDDNGVIVQQGLPLYRAESLPRQLMLLAGLGVERSYSFTFRDHHVEGFGVVGPGADLYIMPVWWSFRTLNEHAGLRDLGKLEHPSDDIYALPMTGPTNAVAVWSVDDAAVVGTTRDVATACDVFGRDLPPLLTSSGSAWLIPAGSVIYLTGTGLTVPDIVPLARITPDSYWASPGGGSVNFTLKPTDAAPAFFGDASPASASFPVDPDAGMWALGAIDLPLGASTLRVPITMSTQDKVSAKLLFNEDCFPEVRVTNRSAEEARGRVTLAAGDGRVDTDVAIPPKSVHKEAVDRRPDPLSDEGMDAEARVTMGKADWTLKRRLYFIEAHPAAITVDGASADWKNVPRTPVREWSQYTEPPTSPQDLSASMAVAYDDQRIYVLTEVEDDIHWEEYPAPEAWRGDSIQLSFDPAPLGEHKMVEMVFALDQTGKTVFYVQNMNLDTSLLEGVVKRAGTQTVYEVSLPLSVLLVAAKAGSRLGLSLIVNENDTGARTGYLHWSNGIGASKNPEEYGQVLFID